MSDQTDYVDEPDHDDLEYHIEQILKLVGEDVSREGLLETPKRVAKMYREMFHGLAEDFDPKHHLDKQFTTARDSMIVVKDIPFYTVCEHHLVPFFGVVHVGYIPGPTDGSDLSGPFKITGLSKFARLVDGYAARPQIQEQLTWQIADAIDESLDPQGTVVVVKAQHMCMSMRGVQKQGSWTVTAAVHGLFATNDDGVKDEFYKLLEI